jgi:CRP/FNR family transcriptional regulator, cyclic AMP receptor protein
VVGDRRRRRSRPVAGGRRKDDRAEKLKPAPGTLLHALQSADMEQLEQTGRPTKLTRGQLLLEAGDDSAVFMLRGAAIAAVTIEDGLRVVSAVLGAGSSCGLAATLGHSGVRTDVQALDDVEALVLTGDALRHLVIERPSLALACLRTVAGELVTAQEEALHFASTSTSDRVVRRLIELADRWGEADGDHVRIGVPLTQEELASWARSSRESTAKTLQGLRRAGIIATRRRELRVLDLTRLRRRVEGGEHRKEMVEDPAHALD